MDDQKYVTNPYSYAHYHNHNFEEDDLDLMKDQSLPKSSLN